MAGLDSPQGCWETVSCKVFPPKGCRCCCCTALEMAKRAKSKGILGSPRTGVSPAVPAAAPGTGEGPVRCWDPGGGLGGDRASRSSLSLATVLSQGGLATSHPLHQPQPEETLHKASAVRSSKTDLPHNRSYFSEGRRMLGSLLFFMKSTHLFALQKGFYSPFRSTGVWLWDGRPLRSRVLCQDSSPAAGISAEHCKSPSGGGSSKIECDC